MRQRLVLLASNRQQTLLKSSHTTVSASLCSVRDDHALTRDINTIFLVNAKYPSFTPKISLISLISLHRPPTTFSMDSSHHNQIHRRILAMQENAPVMVVVRKIFLDQLTAYICTICLVSTFPPCNAFSHFPPLVPPCLLRFPRPNAGRPQSRT